MSWTKHNESKQYNLLNSGIPTLPVVYNLIKSLTEENEFYELEIGEVLDVLLNEDELPEMDTGEKDFSMIGAAKVRLIHSQHGIHQSNLNYIKPLNSNIKEYPLVGEYVIVSTYLGEQYYNNILNILTSVNHNIFVGFSDTEHESDSTNNNKIFSPVPAIRQIWPREGDITINGRFGHAIRFGKNEDTLLPNIKISVGHNDTQSASDTLKPVVENINNDNSSIWILSDEAVNLNAGYNKGKITDFTGNEIILNSDKIILNTKKNELVGYSKNKIYFGAPSIVLHSDDVQVSVDKKDEHLVFGETLIKLLEELLDTLIKNQIATGAGPVIFTTGTTFNPAFITNFKQKLKTILTK